MKQFLLFLLCASLLAACAKIQYNKKYSRESERTLAASIPYASVVFLDNQRVVIQEETAWGYIGSSTGYWCKQGNKISIKSDLQEDSASSSPYHKVEKYLNPTRSLDTVYIHAMDSLGKPIMYPNQT